MDDLDKIIKQLETGASSKRRKKQSAKNKRWIKNQGPSTTFPVTPGIPMPGLK